MSKKNETIVTPKGTLKYPRLFTPDTKFKAEGEYKTSLILSPKEAAPVIAKLKEIHKDAYAAECAAKKKKALKQAAFPWKNETDAEGVETGNIEFKTALKARVEPKGKEAWDQRPQVFDSKRKPVASTTKVGSGTTARLALEVNPWFTDALGFGIQLRLKAVQIIDLVEFSGADASGMFEDEEGFEAPGEGSGAEDEFATGPSDDTSTTEDETPETPAPAAKGKGGKPKSADF